MRMVTWQVTNKQAMAMTVALSIEMQMVALQQDMSMGQSRHSSSDILRRWRQRHKPKDLENCDKDQNEDKTDDNDDTADYDAGAVTTASQG